MINHFRELSKYRELLQSLTVREIKVRYKQTIVGIAWAALQPLVMMLIFTLVFSIFARVSTGDIPYPIFAFSGLVPWTFFATSLTFSAQSLVVNTTLVKKIYFPRELFPISCVLAAFVDFAISFVILMGMMFFYKVPLSVNDPFILIILVIQVIFTLGISFFLSAINVYYRDIRYVVPLGIQLWMFISPIAYPISVVPERFRTIYMLNPMAGIIESYRNVLIEGLPPNFYHIGIAAGVAVILFFLGYYYFKRIEMTFADVI